MVVIAYAVVAFATLASALPISKRASGSYDGGSEAAKGKQALAAVGADAIDQGIASVEYGDKYTVPGGVTNNPGKTGYSYVAGLYNQNWYDLTKTCDQFKGQSESQYKNADVLNKDNAAATSCINQLRKQVGDKAAIDRNRDGCSDNCPDTGGPVVTSLDTKSTQQPPTSDTTTTQPASDTTQPDTTTQQNTTQPDTSGQGTSTSTDTLVQDIASQPQYQAKPGETSDEQQAREKAEQAAIQAAQQQREQAQQAQEHREQQQREQAEHGGGSYTAPTGANSTSTTKDASTKDASTQDTSGHDQASQDAAAAQKKQQDDQAAADAAKKQQDDQSSTQQWRTKGYKSFATTSSSSSNDGSTDKSSTYSTDQGSGGLSGTDLTGGSDYSDAVLKNAKNYAANPDNGKQTWQYVHQQ